MAWWDDERGLGGPSDAGSERDYSSVVRYAQDQRATVRVHVNRGQFELFYKSSEYQRQAPDPSPTERVSIPDSSS